MSNSDFDEMQETDWQRQAELDHHANMLNPNSPDYQAALDNHANQLNPNNPEYKGK